MKNIDIISKKLDEALTYLYNQEQRLQPFISYLEKVMNEGVQDSMLSVKDAFEIFCKFQEQYTNNILLITKIQEIIDFKD